MILIKYSLFFLAVFVSFFIPGFLITQKLLPQESQQKKIVLSWLVGTLFFILLMYALSWVHAQWGYWIIAGMSCLYVLRVKVKDIFVLPSFDKGTGFLILLGSLTFLSLCFFSGWQSSLGLEFRGIHEVDSMAHLAYVKTQLFQFPPEHPGLSGVIIRGYHYFYDFLLSQFVYLFHFSAEDIVFRLFPFYIAVLYGLGFWLFSTTLTKNSIAMRCILFLVYFAQTLSSFMLWTKDSRDYLLGSQPMGLIFDPSVVFSIGIFLAGLYCLVNISRSWGYVVLTGLLIGLLAQIKVYVGFTAFAMLGVYAFYLFLHQKRFLCQWIFTTLIAGILTAVTYLPNNLNAGYLIFMPFRFYSHFIEQPFFDRLHWGVREHIFSMHNNIKRIVLLYVEAIGVFWILHLGIKLIVFMKMPVLLRKSFRHSSSHVLLASAIIFPSLIASIFIQSVSPFNSIQFFWISITLLAIPAGLVLARLYQVNRFVSFVTSISLFILLFPGFRYYEAHYIFGSPVLTISHEEQRVYAFITRQLPKNATLAVLPDKKKGSIVWYEMPVVSAMTGRFVFYEGESTPYALEEEYAKRKSLLTKLDRAIEKCDRKLISATLQTIGTPYLLTFSPKPCLRAVTVEGSSTITLYRPKTYD